MKKTLVLLLVLAALLAGFNSCSTSSAVMPADQAKKVAVVSLTVNNYGGALNWDLGDSLIWNEVDGMLKVTEKELATRWTVVPASDFAASPEFQALAGSEKEVAVPTIDGKKMSFLGSGRDELVGAEIPAEKIAPLIKITGADFLVVVYSEWEIATGKFVPTSKALTKNVIRAYDAEGNSVFYDRHDDIGDRTIGGMGHVAVDENTIDQWVGSYTEALDILIP